MPPVALLAPLAGSLLGSTLLPSLAGSTLLGLGTSTLGGVLGGALAGGLTNKDDPLLGAALGGAQGGFTGPGLSEFTGLGDLVGGLGDIGTAATAAPTSILPEAGVGAGALGVGGGGAATSAASLAAPSLGGAGVTTGLESATLGGEFAPGTFGEALSGAGLPAAPGVDAAVSAAPGALAQGGDLAAAISPTTSAVAPAAGGLPGAGALSPVDVTPQIDLAGSVLEGANAPTTSVGQFLQDPSFATALGALDANKGILAATVPLLQQSAGFSEQSALADQAAQLQANSQVMQSYLQSGTLPPGLQAGLNSARESARAAMRSMYASRGMSGSSSEAAALANIDQTAAAQGAQIAISLLDRGIHQSQLSSALYQTLLKNAMDNDKAFGEAIGRFSAALAA